MTNDKTGPIAVGFVNPTLSHAKHSEFFISGLVSVIIPVYNRERLVLRAIQSALDQTYSSLEIIVVDDGSNDSCEKSIQDYTRSLQSGQDRELRYIRQSRSGPQRARNLGLELAKGEYVRFLDADDWLLPQATADQIGQLLQSGADVCYGAWFEEYDETKVQPITESSFAANLAPDPVAALLGDQWCPNFCYLMRREIALKVGGWSEQYEALQDRDFINRVAFASSCFTAVSTPIGCYWHHSGPRVSRDDKERWLRSMKQVIYDGIATLEQHSQWTDERREAIAWALFHHARRYHARKDYLLFNECIEKLLLILPSFQPPGIVYPLIATLLGYRRAEDLRLWSRRLLRRT